MTRLGLLSFAGVLLATSAHAALFSGGGGGGGGGACPQATDNGCAAAPAGGYLQHSNFYTGYANQTGQVWTTRPAANMPGVDYAVGPTQSKAASKDPTNNSNLPAGCSWDSVDNWVSCTGSGTLTLDSFYFNDERLYVQGTYSAYNLTNDYFVTGSKSNLSDGNMVRIDDPGVASAMLYKSNSFDGQGRNTPVGNGLTTEVQDNRTTAGSSTLTEYNVCIHLNGKCIEFTGAWDPQIKYNYSEDFDGLSTQHGEFELLGTGTMATFTETGNTFLQPEDVPITRGGCCGPTAFSYISHGASGLTITTVNLSWDTYVTNLSSIDSLTTIGAGMMIDRVTSTTVNISNVYVAPTGTPLCFSNSSSTIGTSNFTSNVDLYDNSTIGAFDSQCNGHGN